MTPLLDRGGTAQERTQLQANFTRTKSFHGSRGLWRSFLCRARFFGVLSRCHHDTELLHHAHHVPLGPALHDLAPGDAVDGYPGPHEFVVRGLHTHKGAPVRAHLRIAGDHRVTFGNLDVDLVAEVGKDPAKLRPEGLHRLNAMEITGIPRGS